jgi:glycosyltransferase involved in cell wall biosynthesis
VPGTLNDRGRPRSDLGLRRVLVVNTADKAGGAERSARAILDGFQALGTETRLAVGVKLSNDPRVIPLNASPHIDYRRTNHAGRRAIAGARRRGERWLGMEEFEHPHSRRVLEVTGMEPDLVLLLNLHGRYFDLRVLPWLSRQVPVVVRLCDSWLFTGHCACPLGCGRWETGCGACPDLTIPPDVTRDATRINWHRKRRILSACKLAVITPSQWLMERARRSILAPAIESAKVVPNGLDLAVFTPGSRDRARLALGLDSNAEILLFVAHEGRANPFKDFPTLRAAIELLRNRNRDDAKRLELLVVGREGPLEILGADVRIRHLPNCDAQELVQLYRAADIYVHAAPEETFCNTAAEALACGTPVVAACAGGILEVVEHRRTGVHVTPARPRELAEVLCALLDDEDTRERMGREAATRARARFDSIKNVAEVHAWCAQIASGWS